MSIAIDNVDQLLHHAEQAPSSTRSKSIRYPSAFEAFFVITGGLVVFLPFILLIGEQELSQESLIHWYYWLSVIIGSPHVYATYVRLSRKIGEGKVTAWLGLPAYLGIVLALAAIHSLGGFVLAVTLINVWQSLHYLRQTYGVGCLYGSQVHFDGTDHKLRWWGYHLVFPYLIFGRWDMLYDAWGGVTYELMPVKFGATFMTGWLVVACIGVIIQLLSEVRLYRKNQGQYNPVGILCYVLCIAIHFYGFMILSHFQRGFETVTFFHAMQYLALVWVLERSQRAQAGNRWIAAVPNLVGFLCFWLVLFVLGFGWEQYITTGLEHFWLIASTILLSSISVHHYVVDTFIWRRSMGK